MANGTDPWAKFLEELDSFNPPGGITDVTIVEAGTGYPLYSTTQNVDVTFEGGGSGASGATGKAVFAGNGKLAAISITNRGTGYRVIARQTAGAFPVGSTAVTFQGRPIDGLVTVGMSVDSTCFLALGGSSAQDQSLSVKVSGQKSPPTWVTVTAVSGMTVTFSHPIAVAAWYTCFTFGVPRPVLASASDTDGTTPAKVRVAVGEPKVLVLSPGVYTVGGFSLLGKHNLTIMAEGATVVLQDKNLNGVWIDDNCNNITIIGLKIRHSGIVTYEPANRGTGIGWMVSGYNVKLINCGAQNIANWAIAVRGPQAYGPYQCNFDFVNFSARECAGDGFHIGNSVRNVRVTGLSVINCGDDGFAIYPDEGNGNLPENINATGIEIVNNGWRGIFVSGAKKVNISGFLIRGTSGYGIEVSNYNSRPVEDVSIHGGIVSQVGRTGDGYRPQVSRRYAVVLSNLNRGDFSGILTSEIDAALGFEVTNCTGVHIDKGVSHITSSGNTLCTLGSMSSLP